MLTKTLLTMGSSWLICGSVNALEVTHGQFIQTVYPDALVASSAFSVNDFFDEQALWGRLRNDLIDDIILGPAPLDTNTFVYTVHGPDFITGHPNRNPGINSFPSQFQFSAENILEQASTGRIGLGGVMRFDLPPRADGTPRYFMIGDWTLEYDSSRMQDYNFADNVNNPINPADYQVSGWLMRNHIDFPLVAFDIVEPTTLSNSDSFYLSGELAWSPEMTAAFLPETELYRKVSKFVLCAQDDGAMAEQSAEHIPCVFPNITLNGQSGQVHLAASEPIQLAIDLGIARSEHNLSADYFAAFMYQDTFYWLNQNFEWTTSATSAYQGTLIDFRDISLPSPIQVLGDLPSGTVIPVYFGVDTTQNGLFDAPYRFSSVTLSID